MSEINELKEFIDTLNKIRENFKKNKNRRYSKEYIKQKLIIINKNRTLFATKFKSLITKIDNKTLETFKSKYITIFNEIEEFLTSQENKESDEEFTDASDDIIEINKTEMADFKILEANKLLPEFDGNLTKLTNFLNLTEYIYETLKDEEKTKLINFIINTKLSDTARNKIAVETKPKTYIEFKNLFTKTFKSNRTPLNIQTELINLKQTNLNITTYASTIEKLTFELNNALTLNKDANTKKITNEINDQLALNIFKKGLNEPIKSIIFAAKPASLQDAIQLASEANASQPPSQVFNYRSNTRYDYNNNRGRNNITNRNRYGNNFNNTGRYNSYNRNTNYTRGNNNNNYSNKFNNTRGNNSNNNRQYVRSMTGNEVAVSDTHRSRDSNEVVTN